MSVKVYRYANVLSYVLDFIRVDFNLEAKAKGMSAHNLAKSYNMLHAFDENGGIDYDKIRLTQGKVVGPESAEVSPKEQGILFSWDPQLQLGYQQRQDKVMLMAFDAEGNLDCYSVSGNRRSKGEELLIIPQIKMANVSIPGWPSLLMTVKVFLIAFIWVELNYSLA